MAAGQSAGDHNIERLSALDKRTLPPDGGPEYNRLIFATSPYLLQHAANPVDWYPWGEEPFARAAREDKPVFVSIGYATCHWCHVMAGESFADPEVAAVFNRYFVCIKVDREERPDIDEQYMTAARMMTGGGGWPLNVFMTPDRRPFHLATYLPRNGRMGLPGIIPLLERVAQLWRTERQQLEANGAEIVAELGRQARPLPGTLPDRALADRALRQLAGMHDRVWGGFGAAPKFPMPVYVTFLLRQWRRTGDGAPLGMAEQLLRMLRRGGICDQLGFGFHRYSVDRQWLVPHFEKMLYDQALLAMAYLETHQATGDPFYLEVAEEIFAHVLGEMTTAEGGFCAGQDADTAGGEGACYLWTPDEIQAVLGQAEGELCCRLFGVTREGNFEGRSILHLPVPVEEFAAGEGIAPARLKADLERWRRRLLQARRERDRPFRDEKVLTAWNGLMIAALARGYGVTGKGSYLEAARRAAELVGRRLTTPEGRLMRSYHLGQAAIPAFLEDYACFISGLIELHQATLEQSHLERAGALAAEMLRLFGSEGGGLFDTGSDSTELPVRTMGCQDGVLPSGNSMAAFDLFRLGRITGDRSWLAAGERIVRAFMGQVAKQPLAAPYLLSAADYHLGTELTVTLTGTGSGLEELLRVVHRRWHPGLALCLGEEEQYPALHGRATAYVCARGACRPPVAGSEALAGLLDEIG